MNAPEQDSVIEESSESGEEQQDDPVSDESDLNSYAESPSDKKRRLDEWWEQLSDQEEEDSDDEVDGRVKHEPRHTSTVKGDAKYLLERDKKKHDRENELERSAKDEETNQLILKFRELCGKAEMDGRFLRGHDRDGIGRPQMPRRYPGFNYSGMWGSPADEQELVEFLKKLPPAELNTVTSVSGSFLNVAARYNRPEVCLWLLGNPFFNQRSAGNFLCDALMADIGYDFRDMRLRGEPMA